MATKSSLILSFLFVVLFFGSYTEKAKAGYEIARGPIINFRCHKDIECQDRNRCWCSPCSCVNNICQCPSSQSSDNETGL
ncbi:hypothetical protein M5689_022961 [Euphorbia peplus]|nr:hypothetical protein M5689_022961 [Euphorbia peplus]